MKKHFYFSRFAVFSKKVCSILGILALLAIHRPAAAQGTEDEKFSLNVLLNSDIFFGFYPSFQGKYKINEKLDFSFYGILWSGGTGSGWGNWTEFGVGVNLPVSDNLYILPQIGLLSGSLTSGLGTPVLGEGIVPNLTLGYSSEKLESELYGGYYLGFDHGNPNTNNYLHYWINGGIKLSKLISAGVHLEHLRFMGGKNHPGNASFDFYNAVGPYVKIGKPNGGVFARFIGGWDLRSTKQVEKSEYSQPSFFKLSLGYVF